MLRSLLAPHSLRGTRFLSQAAAAAKPTPAPPRTAQSAAVRYPYFVPRNSRGNLPVYTDVRNNGSRYFVLIRNVDGNANQLAADLVSTLFERGSEEASRFNVEIQRSKNLIITGGRWKNQVVEWLKEKGF